MFLVYLNIDVRHAGLSLRYEIFGKYIFKSGFLGDYCGLCTFLFLVGLVIRTRKRLGKPIVAPRIMRYFVLPTLAVYLFCRYVLELPRSHFSIRITETILIIFAISFVINFLNHLIFSEDNVLTREERLPKLGRDIIHFFLILLASAVVFSNIWGVHLGSLLAALGVGSLVLGLALQEPLGNLFNGIALLMAKPFQTGDWIRVGDQTGKVLEINWRSVKIVNRYNELIIIPNNILGKETIHNLSRPDPLYALTVRIGFSYDDAPEKVKKMLLDVAGNTEGILNEPPPKALTVSYDDFAITYELKFYVRDYSDSKTIRDAFMTRVYDAAGKAGIRIPFPVREVYLRKEGD